jgi:hypothetical protein
MRLLKMEIAVAREPRAAALLVELTSAELEEVSGGRLIPISTGFPEFPVTFISVGLMAQ